MKTISLSPGIRVEAGGDAEVVIAGPKGRHSLPRKQYDRLLRHFAEPVALPDAALATFLAQIPGEVEAGLVEVGPAADRANFVTLDNPRCAQIFLVFAGLAGKLMIAADEFFAQTGLTSRNIVQFVDPARRLYAYGINDRVRSLREIIVWLQGYLSARPALTEVYCVGTSMGAFTAIQVGCVLRVKAVWAFAPPRLPFGRGTAIDPSVEWDLPRLIEAAEGATACNIFYSEGHERDRSVAEALAPLPGVRTFPQPGGEHSVVATLAKSGGLRGLFPPFAAVPSLPTARGLTRDELLTFVRSLTRTERLDVDSSLSGLVDSFGVVEIVAFIEDRLGGDVWTSGHFAPGTFATVASIFDSMESAPASRRQAGATLAAPLPDDRTFLHRVVELGTGHPQAAFSTLVPRQGSARRLSYGDLHEGALAVARGLRAGSVAPGQVVAIVLDDDHEIAVAFLGSLYAGALPTVLAPPSPKVEPARYRSTLRALAGRTQPALLVTSRALRSLAHELVGELPIPGGVVTLDDLRAAREGAFDLAAALARAADRGTAAFLQHSSGTTGLQKGVVVTYEMLRRNLEMLADAVGHRPDDSTISWLPLHHDMGLCACLLFSMYAGGRLVQLPTFDWLQDPALLLDEITRRRSTLCWMPNFAFLHLSHQARRPDASWDLGSMRMFINCSEPITVAAFERFRSAFAPHGLGAAALATSYAMAENVFVVSQSPPGETPRSIEANAEALRQGVVKPASPGSGARRTLVSSGRVVEGNALRIVGEDGTEVPDGVVGEILVAGPCRLTGYHHNPEATAAALADGWYRTGDLGFCLGGDLFVTGRKKDLILVAGENHYPEDVEDAAGATGLVHPGRVAAVGVFDENRGTERLVVMLEPRREAGRAVEEDAIVEAVRRAVGDTLGLTPAQVLVVPDGWLVKSTSGKISRAVSAEKAWAEGLLRER